LARPSLYSIQSNNDAIDAKLGILEPRITKASNEVIFFTLNLGKIAGERQAKLLADARFAPYKYFLERIFLNSKYNLGEEAEKVNSLMERPARTLWIDGFEKLMNQQTVKFKEENVPLAKALGLIHQLTKASERHALSDLTMEKFKSISFFAEQEINAVYTTKKISDELRGYKKPYSETILAYENDEKGIENLVKTVTENFHISHKFYKMKAKILGMKSLEYSDRAIGITSKERVFQFSEAVEILRTSFGKASPKYVEILDMMLANKKIDAPSRVGKRGGAYCWGGPNVPTVVLLNYTPGVKSVTTFAHEMGHAIHTEFSNNMPPLYQNYTMSVAETASTFFENLAFEEIYSRLTETEKIYALYERVNESIQTIFRQIAGFNFELDLHDHIRSKGKISALEIGAAHNKNMSAYLGSAVKMKEIDGYFFEPWSHINFFYVYSYAYGCLISKALYAECKKDPLYFKKVDQFMMSGRKMTPEDIFKSIGIDVTKPSFFENGLKTIENDINELEKLMKKNKMI
jgi:oligoendopeptidase F